MQRLSQANLALMLSWHEGFGLTGWEAIAAEVPLIVSENSGLYRLIVDELHGAGKGCIRSIDVAGRRGGGSEVNFTSEDLNAVADEILRVAGALEYHKNNARHLKKMLIQKLGCTWRDTAQDFLRPLAGVSEGKSDEITDQRRYRARERCFVEEAINSMPDCAELTAGTTQGSDPGAFDLLPELRFGRGEFEVDTVYVSYGIAEAMLTADLVDCRIVPGARLGDVPHPHVVAGGNNSWKINGPKEGQVLLRRALGNEKLCKIEARPGGKPRVRLDLRCRARHVVYDIVINDESSIVVNEARILEAFFNKCLNSNQGIVLLSQATISVEDDGS